MAKGDGIHRINGLEVDEDLDFQRRSWRVQRVARVFVALFVIAAFVGLLGGGGWLGTIMIETSGGTRVEFPRFVRNYAPFDLVIDLPLSSAGGEASVSLEGSLLRGILVENISPEPETQELSDGWTTYAFNVQEGDPPPIIFGLEANKPGLKSGRIRFPDGSTVELKQFVYP